MSTTGNVMLKEALGAVMYQAHQNILALNKGSADHYWDIYTDFPALQPYRDLRDVWLTEYSGLDPQRWDEQRAFDRLTTLDHPAIKPFDTNARESMCRAFLVWCIFLKP